MLRKRSLKQRVDELSPQLSELATATYFAMYPPTVGKISSEEIMRRIQYSTMLTSMWAHVCMVDGELAVKEQISVGEMMNRFFGEDDALFPQGQVDTDAVFADLTETFLEPFTIDEIVKYVDKNRAYATLFFEEACCITISDEVVHDIERKFLDTLAIKFRLPHFLQETILQKYLRETE